MGLIVQKYGGTSVADAERIKRVAAHICETRDAGNDVVVVVSAMGKTTDELIRLAHQVSRQPPSKREFDMLLSTGEQVSIALLAMAIHDLGKDAVSLTGQQVGIKTDARHSQAKIIDVGKERIHRALAENQIVIVAGFQGVNEEAEITTLGRGGSDTTAVALAAVLKADICEIFTDVEGVFTADPRLVPTARKLKWISYDEMLELASLGAGVLVNRAVEFAKKYQVPVAVRSSFTFGTGTMVIEETDNMESEVIRGVTFDKSEAKMSLLDVPNVPGIAGRIFGALAQENINVDMIIQGAREGDCSDISFTVSKDDLDRAAAAAEKIRLDLGASQVLVGRDIAKISVVGIGMKAHCGVAAKMFQALAEAGINIQMISTSEIKISCVVSEEQAAQAVAVLHKTFELEQSGSVT